MASPTAGTGSQTTGATASTNHNTAAFPLVAGKLYIFFIRFTSAPGTVTSASGKLTQLASDVSDASDDQSMIWYRVGDGTEVSGDTALTSTSSVKSLNLWWVVTGAANPAVQLPSLSTVAVGTTTANTANPASVAVTGGPLDVLYLAMCGYDGSGGVPTAAPTNYTGLVTQTVTGGGAATQASIGGASRGITASSSDDPGVFTHPAANSGWTAWTVVVYPPAAAAAGIPDVGLALTVT